MHESVLAGRRDGLDQAGGHCLIELAQAAEHGLAHHPGNHLDGEVPTDDRRCAQQPHGFRREPSQPFVDRLQHAQRDRRGRRGCALPGQRPAHLTDEEGIATRDHVHPSDLCRCDVAPDQRGELLADGCSGQTSQIDPPGDRLPGKSRDENVGYRLGVPVVDHHQ